MIRVVPLTEALRSRMQLAAQVLSERVDPGAWRGYSAAERLEARLTRPDDLGNCLTLEYRRPGNRDAQIVLGFLDMVDIRTQKTVSETVIEDNIEERKLWEIELPAGASEEETYTHAFAKTRTFEQAAKRAWEAGGKASLSASYAGIGGSVEVYGKYGESFDDSHGGSETESDTISRKFRFEGPIKTTLEAYRSRQRRERIVRAQCDIDGKLYFIGASTAWEFCTYKSQFLPIARRTADDSIYGYSEFMAKPVSDGILDLLEAPPDATVDFPVPFDAVTAQHLKPIE